MAIRNRRSSCRRRGCGERQFWLGLCVPHWARWHDGLDALDRSDDHSPAPPRSVFTAPARAHSLSARMSMSTVAPAETSTRH